MTQIPLFTPESSWRPPDMSSLPSWEGAKRVGFDVETKDNDLKKMGPGMRREGNRMVGYSFAIEDGPKYYVPFAHEGGDNVDQAQALAYLRDQAKHFPGILAGANLSYDLEWAGHYDVRFSKVKFFRDVQVADVLINELHNSYSLDAILQRYNLPTKNEDALREAAQAYAQPTGKRGHKKVALNPKADLWRLPARFVGVYGEDDAELPLRLLRLQERRIEEQDLWQIYDLESRVLPVLVKLRQRGVAINQDKLAGVEAWALDQETQTIAEIKRKWGYDIGVGNIWQDKAVQAALDAAGVDVSKLTSLDKEVMGSLHHEIGNLILWARKTNKLRTTFAASVRTHMTNGRIHCTLNQLARDDEEGGVKGARYGRLSSEKPNLQQQPARDEFAKMWRAIYEPEPDTIWGCLDYSQQEPRITTHFAEKAGCRGATTAGDRYRDDPTTDNHQMMADICGIGRKPAKEIYLGLCYGMGGAKMAHKLGLPIAMKELRNGRTIAVAGPECQQLIDSFDRNAPFVRDLAKLCQSVAEQRGFILTLLGRHCRFPKDDQGEFDWTHKALNRLIQGSAADQTKLALVETDAAGYYIQLQVHDELDGSFESPAQADACADLMRHCVELTVPSKVDVELGPNWGDIVDISEYGVAP